MSGTKIILGVTGGIAAYKAPELVRRLRDRGAIVQVVMTHSAREFTTETALQAVSGRPVRSDLWDPQAEAAMGHIELARWADRILVAPATAEFMARLAGGFASDLLGTLCLATTAPICLAPAMNHVMWASEAVQANRRLLESRGVQLLGPDIGDQACGESGPGRMLQPEAIAKIVAGPVAVARTAGAPLRGKTVMITAGPTLEAIDPVRFISNRSSGKMGYSMASAAAAAGAKVLLLSGPVSLPVPRGVECTDIESAEELHAAVHRSISGVDIFIGAAAVSDYRPAATEPNKIKRVRTELRLDLVRNPDILASVAELPRRPFTVGFAAETEKLREHALQKLEQKKLDMIIANKVGHGVGFDSDENAVDVYWKNGQRSFSLSAKAALAGDLIELIAERYAAYSDSAGHRTRPAVAIRD
ncbi:MAG TPA: bifunctional phosphopantothenoylcysteine decarboxylase/phosphopantothenate--cysteine ligase CoaBC [Woeseiaceae bacterium]|nr:bifunctional phosphopantothenoylcysteine decarboxylase/phosphopantothenate--cysteine ligase CoaBC [Woeseiaceae bacterium]